MYPSSQVDSTHRKTPSLADRFLVIVPARYDYGRAEYGDGSPNGDLSHQGTYGTHSPRFFKGLQVEKRAGLTPASRGFISHDLLTQKHC